jgi:transmembrane sensor
MTNERFVELFDKSRAGILSETEAIEWNEWIALSAHNREMVERIHDEEYLNTTVSLLAKARQEDWQYILEKHPELKPEGAVVKRMNKIRPIGIWIAAAVAVLLIVLLTYPLINEKVTDRPLATAEKQQMQDVGPPDMTKATITLANGQVVALDTITSGVLAMQGKVNVVKTTDEQITYKKAEEINSSGEIAYNVLRNPRGSKIVSISLSDGTTIWLNSESTLRYPVVFNGNERRVELTGEAYFEAASSFIKGGKKRPFYVKANEVTVEVLGTHFNVSNYSDESTTKVTLLEGSVKVGNKGQSVLLKPGEQTSVSQSSQPSNPIPVQTDKVMSWKNNTFYFDGENLQVIMNQLARYYNVEVEYEGKVPDKKFGGMINRNKNLSEVLNVLELSGVQFRVEGKKIIVSK